MAEDEFRHPALAGARWPVIGARVRREGAGLQAAFWAGAKRGA